MTQQAKQNLIEAIPAAAAIATWLAGIPVEKWAAAAGLGFIVLQAVGFLWRLLRDMRHERERTMRSEPPPPKHQKEAP